MKNILKTYGRMVVVVLLLLFVLLLNTYLSKLSLTGDFDGKDHGRLTRYQQYLHRLDSLYTVDTANFQKIPASDWSTEDTLKKLVYDTLRTEVISREAFELKLDSTLSDSILRVDTTKKRLVTSLLQNTKPKPEGSLKTLTKDSLETLKKDSLEALRKDSLETLTKVSLKTLDSIRLMYSTVLNEKLDTMIALRDRKISLGVLSFWPMYFDIVHRFIKTNDLIALLMNVLISPMLYLLIFFLASVLTWKILIRYRKKYRTILFMQKVEPFLDQIHSGELETFLEDDDINHVGVGVVQFIKQLCISPKITEHTIDAILFEDDNETEHFTRATDFINTWILRLGILGTLLGITLAFYEVAKAVVLIKAMDIPLDFKQRIREALTGHAISVVTALAAQFTSLLYEILSLEKAGVSLSKDWLIVRSRSFIEPAGSFSNIMELSKKLENDINGGAEKINLSLKRLNDINEAATNTHRDFQDIIQKAHEALRLLNSTSEDSTRKVEAFDKALRNVNEDLKLTEEKGKEVKEHVDKLEAGLLIVDKLLHKITRRTRFLHNYIKDIASRIYKTCISIFHVIKKAFQ